MTLHAPAGAVPTSDSVSNVTSADVVGSKLDTSAGDSIYARVLAALEYLEILNDHIHSVAWVLPDRANSITVTAGAGWGYGAESVTLGTPSAPFDIHWISIVADDNAQYQIQILVDGVPVTEKAFERVGVFSASIDLPITSVIKAAGSITAKLASSSNGASCTIKVEGHNY